MAFPPQDHGHSNPAFVHRTLLATERKVARSELARGAAVVTEKHDQRVLIESFGAQLREDFAEGEESEAELAWLRENIYGGREGWQVERLDPRTRYARG
jgi:hypothetical protein